MKITLFISVLSVFILSTAAAQGTRSGPSDEKIKAYVTDQTGTLSQPQTSALEKKLSDFEQETSNQVVVFMMSTLEGGSLEETSFELAEKNGIGQKGKDNGVLLLIVKDDRKLRIEVGYGLEGALPDALCSQIIRKEITPYFKQGKFYEGINAGVDAIIKATKGEYTQEKSSRKDEKEFGIGICGLPILVIVIFFFFGFFFILSVIKRIFGWGGRSRSGWWNTGGSSGSSWSSGSSFGGFSGGGGSFGGGGASGSW